MPATVTTEKPKFMSSLMRLAPFLKPYWRRWLATAVALGIASSTTLTLPIAFRHLIDSGFTAGNSDYIDQYFIALLVLACILAVATAMRFYLVSWLGERISADLRSSVYRHVITMSPQYFETTQTGEVLSRLTTDTSVIQTLVGTSFSMGLRNLFMLIGGIVMLTVTSHHLAGYISLALVCVVLPIYFFGRKVRKLSRDSQDRIADTSALAGEVLNAMPTVQAYTQEARESERFNHLVEAAFDTALTRIRARSWLTIAVILLIFSSITLVLWLGAKAVIAGEMSVGELSQFILYAVVTAGSIGALAEVWGELQRAAGAIDRLMELLHSSSPVHETDQPLILPAEGGGIQFNNITFAYPARPAANIVQDFSLTIRQGEHLALVGPSGAGKTTLFQLLLRFYEAQSGSITLHGVNLRDLTLQDSRRPFSIVLQDTVIFSGSVLDNIRYGCPAATMADVELAAKMAAADGFITALPEGYQTFLGERGVRLSGGQRQRISIARAILNNPEILLLDEATSALDAESEQQVQIALDNATQHRTTLVIAHRLATVQAADRIVVMDAGRIIAQGKHAELMTSCPLYAKLARLQFTQ